MITHRALDGIRVAAFQSFHHPPVLTERLGRAAPDFVREEAKAVKAGVQIFEERRELRVAGLGDDKIVELFTLGDTRVLIALLQGPFGFVENRFGLFELLVGQTLGGEAGGQPFERAPDGGDLRRFPDRDAGDIDPFVRDAGDQPLGFQLVEGLSQGDFADAELAGQVIFDEGHARLELQ